MAAPSRAHLVLGLKVVVLAVSCVLVYRTIMSLGPAQVWAQAQGAHQGWLVAAVAAILARYLFWHMKWRNMLARHGPVEAGLVWHMIMANSFVNLVTPSAKIAGGFLRAMVLKLRYDWSFPSAYGQVIADQLTHLLAKMILLGSLLLWSTYALPQLMPRATAAILGCCLLLIALPWLAWRAVLRRQLEKLSPHSAWRRRLSAYSRKVTENGEDAVEELFKPLLQGGSNRQVWSNDLLLSALSFGVFCYSNGLVLHSLGVEVSWPTVALVVLLGYLAGTMMGIMGGIGVTELFLMKLYASCGIPEEAAAAAALLHRGLFYAYLLLVGSFSFLVVGKKV